LSFAKKRKLFHVLKLLLKKKKKNSKTTHFILIDMTCLNTSRQSGMGIVNKYKKTALLKEKAKKTHA
jgi:hypothetical protein